MSMQGLYAVALVCMPCCLCGAQVVLERRDDSPAKRIAYLTGEPAVAGVLRGPGPPVRIHQANVGAGGLNILNDAANEPSIAIDPTGPNRIVIGWRQFDTVSSNFRQAGYGYSRDGGRTWTARVIDRGVFRTDPVLRFNSEGVLLWNALYQSGSVYRCDIFRSLNAGLTWSGPYNALGGDKAWIAIDRTGGGSRGAIYQAWNTAGNNYAPYLFNRCFDNGASWTDLTFLPGSPVFGQVAVAVDGSVVVAGVPNSSFTTTFYCTRSPNAGLVNQTPAFAAAVLVNMGGAFSFGAAPNPGGLSGQVNLAVDHSDGPRRGWLYMLASVAPTGSDPMDIVLVRSTDNGQTWSPPVQVNTDPPRAGAWQWMGTMSVSSNGRLDVVWIDTRESLTANLGRLYYRSSEDGGVSWSSEVPIGPQFNSHAGWPNQNKMGDYFDMESDRLGASLACCTTYTGGQDVYFVRIGPDDCNSNGVADDSEIAAGSVKDCNHNGIPDPCDIAAGLLAEADANGNGEVTPSDIAAFIAAWLEDLEGGTLHADSDRNGAVEPADISLMVSSWILSLSCQ